MVVGFARCTSRPHRPRQTFRFNPRTMALRRFAASTLAQLGQPWAAAGSRGFAKGTHAPGTRSRSLTLPPAHLTRPRKRPQWRTASSTPSRTSGPSWRATS
jgi:hypothetical protein